ncbi:hypothetical protein BB934_45125 (plasmid) [Microvirga ossetica]|uniref:Uncharacterized protein n=1 Tax=Microvirga ossetica TaxID=1882682 RepID=A0A1B2EZM8_9HYPH|nr:hypothetical protein BB934_45125 [Microvirga ossetica]
MEKPPEAPTHKTLTATTSTGWQIKCKSAQEGEGHDAYIVGQSFYPQATALYEEADNWRERQIYELYFSGFRGNVPRTSGSYVVKYPDPGQWASVCDGTPVVTAYGSGSDAWETITSATLDDGPVPVGNPWPALPKLWAVSMRLTLDNGFSFSYGGSDGTGYFLESDIQGFRNEAAKFVGADVYFNPVAWTGDYGDYRLGKVFLDGRANHPDPWTDPYSIEGLIEIPLDAGSPHQYVCFNGVAPCGGNVLAGSVPGPHDSIISLGDPAGGWARITSVTVNTEEPW